MAALQLQQVDNNIINDTSSDGAAAVVTISSELMPMPDATGGESGSSSDSGAGADAWSNQIARSLVSVGFLTLLMDTAVVLHKPPGGVVFGRRVHAYYLTLAGIFAAGLAELWTAFSLSRSGDGATDGHRVAFARAVLYASLVPLVIVIDLGGFSVLVKV